jgi:hypothetical protein
MLILGYMCGLLICGLLNWAVATTQKKYWVEKYLMADVSNKLGQKIDVSPLRK